MYLLNVLSRIMFNLGKLYDIIYIRKHLIYGCTSEIRIMEILSIREIKNHKTFFQQKKIPPPVDFLNVCSIRPISRLTFSYRNENKTNEIAFL